MKEEKMAAGVGCIVMLGLVIGLIMFVLGKCSGGDDDSGSRSQDATPLEMAQVMAGEEMRKILREPNSAEYRNVRAHRLNDTFLFCGEVNARNGFGGYTGFQRFVAVPTTIALTEGMPQFAAVEAEFCVPETDAGEARIGW